MDGDGVRHQLRWIDEGPKIVRNAFILIRNYYLHEIFFKNEEKVVDASGYYGSNIEKAKEIIAEILEKCKWFDKDCKIELIIRKNIPVCISKKDYIIRECRGNLEFGKKYIITDDILDAPYFITQHNEDNEEMFIANIYKNKELQQKRIRQMTIWVNFLPLYIDDTNFNNRKI